ncbi:MAG: hypothetical protein Q9213_000126 [Squamulea squamosa]
MGQRHQLFVIAKIRNRFRTLAVVHHQWLYEVGPLERCIRLTQIFQAESNRSAIEQELRAAREKDGGFWATKESQPFPCIATCLLVGSSFDPDKGYQRRVHLLAFNTTLDQIDNNDGITIIDISDPFNVNGLKPQSASAYLWRYLKHDEDDYNDEDDEWSDDSKIQESYVIPPDLEWRVQQFDSVDLISPETLRNWLNSTSEDNDGSWQEHRQLRASKQSLRDQAMDQLINTALNDPSYDLSALEEAQQLPGFAAHLRTKMLSLGQANELPSTPNLVHCFEMAFNGEQFIDLSPFSNMTTEQLVDVASKLLRSDTVKALNLSHLRQISEHDLMDILCIECHLETLYVMEMSQISLTCLTQLWSQNPALKDIYHTELFRLPLTEEYRYSDLMSMVQSPSITNIRNPVKNIMFVRVLVNGSMKELKLRKADGVTIDWQRSKLAGTGGKYDNSMFFSVFPINDTLLTPTKLINGLANFLHCASTDRTSCSYHDASPSGFTMAKSFASASSCIGDSSTTIGPLPGLLFRAASTAARVSTPLWPVPFPELKVGEFSIVIVNEHNPYSVDESPPDIFRIAVVSPKSAHRGEGYHVQSMETYLENLTNHSPGMKSQDVVDLLRYWKEQMGFVGSCRKEEIDELLLAAEKNLERARRDLDWGLPWDYVR